MKMVEEMEKMEKEMVEDQLKPGEAITDEETGNKMESESLKLEMDPRSQVLLFQLYHGKIAGELHLFKQFSGSSERCQQAYEEKIEQTKLLRLIWSAGVFYIQIHISSHIFL